MRIRGFTVTSFISKRILSNILGRCVNLLLEGHPSCLGLSSSLTLYKFLVSHHTSSNIHCLISMFSSYLSYSMCSINLVIHLYQITLELRISGSTTLTELRCDM